MLACTLCGCSRSEYRVQADQEAYQTIEERNHDPRWRTPEYSVDMDPRSRFYENNSEDCPPMPKDDPTAHEYMHLVNGKEGWQHWHENGTRGMLENPAWRDNLPDYVAVSNQNIVQLDLDSAIQLAYLHSPNHQTQLETMYLSALDVSGERFQLETQLFAGYGGSYRHRGKLANSTLSYDPVSRGWVVSNPGDVAGLENNRHTLGRPSLANPALLAQKNLATAGQLLAGFANSFVFEFTGGDGNLSASLANFSFIQPLLRGAGQDIALENLTFDERKLLGNLRAYSQFRQGFLTQVTIGELGVAGPQRGGAGTSIQSFGGNGFVGGYLGILQQEQELRFANDNLILLERTLDELTLREKNNAISLIQVYQFRQSVESQKASLLSQANSIQLAKDRFKTQTLGLPPDVPIDLDKGLIDPFQFFSREVRDIQTRGSKLQQSLGKLRLPGVEQPEDEVQGIKPPCEDQPEDQPEDNEPLTSDALKAIIAEIRTIVPPVIQLFQSTRQDFRSMKAITPDREAEFKREFGSNYKAVVEFYRDIQCQEEESLKTLEATLPNQDELDQIEAELSRRTLEESHSLLISWLRQLRLKVDQLSLIQARCRSDLVDVSPVDLTAPDAYQMALTNRLDFMNGRAALVDSWRLIQVRADALQSVLDVTAAGDVRTSGNNPADFRAPTSNLRLGLEFDAPVTRLLERNAYRESLITYQRSRRSFIQSRDSLHLGLRALLRDLDVLRRSLSIRRRALWIAIGQVDQTQSDLENPQAQLGPTTTFNLLGAASALRESQNSFLRTWLSYQAARLRLARELGIMELNDDGTLNRASLPGEPKEMVPPLPGETRRSDELPPMIPENLVFELTPQQGGMVLAPTASGPTARPDTDAIVAPQTVLPQRNSDEALRAELKVIRAMGRSEDPGRLFRPTSHIVLPQMQPTQPQSRNTTVTKPETADGDSPNIRGPQAPREGQMSPLSVTRPSIQLPPEGQMSPIRVSPREGAMSPVQ